MAGLRRITTDDADAALIGALVGVFRTAREECLRFTLDLHDAAEDFVFLRDVVLPKNQVWVAEIGGSPARFIAFAGGRVNHLYVAPAFQGRGIGTRLLDVTKEASPSLDLWVFQVNTPAIEFYERRG